VPKLSYEEKEPVVIWKGRGSNPKLLPGVKIYDDAFEQWAAGDAPGAELCRTCVYQIHLRNT
jgi:hypothetical protein